MSLQKPTSKHLPAGFLPGKLPVVRVLYEAEIPIIYISETSFGQTLLAYVADEASDGLFTLISPTSERIIAGIDQGTISVRDGLSSSTPWLHWTNGTETEAWAIDIDQIPQNHLPHPHFVPDPEREPVFRTRATGDDIVQGRMPASVVAFVADATRKALKVVLDYKLAVRSDGRPSDEHRSLYDLPIQSFAFSSFELSFATPDDGIFTRDDVKDAAAKLERGLQWASEVEGADLPEDEEERETLLRAALLLTPPSSGPIKEIHVSGRWICSNDLVLTKDARKRIRTTLREVDSEELVTYSGQLEEIDAGKYTFTLRRTNDGIDRKGSFVEDVLDDMISFLNEKVIIAGIVRRNRLEVHAIVAAPINIPSEAPSNPQST